MQIGKLCNIDAWLRGFVIKFHGSGRIFEQNIIQI